MNCLDQTIGENFALYHGDCVEVLKGLPASSVHYSIFSPPFASQQEGAVVANLRRKEADARAMADAMAAETLGAVRENILGRTKDTNPYHATARMLVPSFMEAA